MKHLGPVYKERGLPLCQLWATLASRLKLQLWFTSKFHRQGYPITQVNFATTLLTCFVMRDILCNGPKFEIIWKFSTENTLNSRKKGKCYHRRQKITFYFSDVYNKLSSEIGSYRSNWHDGRKLTWVFELSLAECLQDRQGNPTCLVNMSCEKRRSMQVLG